MSTLDGDGVFERGVERATRRTANPVCRPRRLVMKRTVVTCVLLLLATAGMAKAQTFSSGSTGADGALDTSAMTCAVDAQGRLCEVQLPPNGVLNYTTVNVFSGDRLVFKPNLQNTPVYLRAQGAVTIAGQIDLNGGRLDRRTPGPGGFHGGALGLAGFGPGAGPQPDGSPDGRWVGPLSLVPLIGGSGGRGGRCDAFSYMGSEGSGGGGAIVIASSTSVTVAGSISANGGSFFFDPGCSGNWGFGAGGAIRIVANSIVVSGALTANGGCQSGWGWSSCRGLPGVIRIEAPLDARAFSGSSSPAAVLSQINPTLGPSGSDAPSLAIVSVGGYAVPAYSGQRFDTVDLLLPMQLPDPIPVVVVASNIPTGTSVGINFGTSNAGTVTPGTLTGSDSSSSATVLVSGLNRSQLAYLFVSATFNVPSSLAALNRSGVDRVAQLRVTAAPGAAPQYSFMRADGSPIEPARLAPAFLRHFGR
jgi:hypothetical protein